MLDTDTAIIKFTIKGESDWRKARRFMAAKNGQTVRMEIQKAPRVRGEFHVLSYELNFGSVLGDPTFKAVVLPVDHRNN